MRQTWTHYATQRYADKKEDGANYLDFCGTDLKTHQAQCSLSASQKETADCLVMIQKAKENSQSIDKLYIYGAGQPVSCSKIAQTYDNLSEIDYTKSVVLKTTTISARMYPMI